MTAIESAFPLGASVTLEALDVDPYPVLAELRAHEPVSWLPVLDGWLVTRRDLCIEVMRDAVTFTVDDPRFSTAQVVGPSMLSLDGEEHRRHRDPFAAAFLRPEARARFTDRVEGIARELVAELAPAGRAEIRRDLAGRLAVRVVAAALDLLDVPPATVLGWYDEIVAAVDRVSVGGEIGPAGRDAAGALRAHVIATIDRGVGVLADATETMTPPEVASNAAVMMFGGIETSEGMTTTLFWHLLRDPAGWDAVVADPSLRPGAIEESLRLEPAAGRVDRYATTDVSLAGAEIRRGDLVIVSLTGANRDPASFADPDTFDLARPESRSHVAFAQGPHACVGPHLARLETRAALDAVIDLWPGVRVADGVTPPTGVVFRKPRSLPVVWDA
ncbi:MAG: cytochrome P450 [Candidatus Limnocylindrales bacterium]